jgi:hypothetical protein
VRFLALLLCLLVAALASASSVSAEVNAQQAIAFLNQQRAANGIPAGIVENADWTEGCRLHMAFLQMNNLPLMHEESSLLPGYTEQGAEAGGSSVLSSWGYEADGENPWEDAPIHLMQLLGPKLSVTGYANGCMTTWPGYQRPDPPSPVLYSYPGDGVETVPHAQYAAEQPFVPGDFVGLPMGTRTGPHLYLLAFGTERGRLTSASLTGPNGLVEVRTVDNSTGSVGNYLPPGGIVIPAAPLVADAPHKASATFTDDETVLTRTWSFRTEPDPQPPEATLRLTPRGVTFTSKNPSPVALTVHRIPSGTPLLDTTAELSGGRAARPLSLLPARHRACARQPRTRAWGAVRRCISFRWRVSAGAKWVKAGRRVLVFRAGKAAGQRAYLSFQTLVRDCRGSRCRYRTSSRVRQRTVKLRPRTRIRLPAADGHWINLTLKAFERGDLLYKEIDSERVFKHRSR